MTTRIEDTISNKLWFVLICLVLIFVILTVYWQVREHEFVDFDDDIYIYNNPYIQAGLTRESIAWAFNYAKEVDQKTGIWHPLTSLSHILDIQFFGLNADRHHLMNVAFHIVNTLLLLFVFNYMTGKFWPSAFIAALFALHPQHVESVAWASERKDVLSTMFWMLTLITYVYYTKRPSIIRYILILLAFVLGLMSKPMLVTLPFVLLLLDYWPLQRLNFTFQADKPVHLSIFRLVIEKIPLFILSAIFCVISYFAQKSSGAVTTTDDFSLKLRIYNVAFAYVEYIKKFFYPVNLSALYPVQSGNLTLFRFLVCLAILVALSVCFFYWRRHRYLTTGWLWFLGTLVPVIGLVKIGEQSMADRYTYISHIGLAVIVAWGVSELSGRMKYRKAVLWTASLVLLSSFAIMSARQVATWSNSVTLFEHAIKVVPNNWWAHKFLANTLQRQEQYDDAIKHFQQVFQIKPSLDIQHKIGNILLQQGKFDEVIELYQQILPPIPENAGRMNITPEIYSKLYEVVKTYTEGHFNLAVALEQKGQTDQAIKHFKEVLRIRPDYILAHQQLMELLIGQERFDEVIENCTKLLDANQISGEILTSLGIALLHKDRIDKAVICFEKAIQLEPNNPNVSMAYYHYGDILVSNGYIDEAIENYRQALKTYPEWLDLLNKLAGLLATYNESKYYDPPGAVSLAQKVCEKVNYSVPELLDTLAMAYASDGKFAQAVETAEKAVKAAESAGNNNLALEIRNRLELYKNGKAYHKPLPKMSEN